MTGSVCVIDDDAEVRGSIGSLMRSSGYEVRLYEGTAQFLEAGLPPHACCLVLDIRLSGETGSSFRSVFWSRALRCRSS
jgi:FixJ family two-component response regulator